MLETHQPLVQPLRQRFASAYAPNPWIYYGDLLGSATLGWSSFVAAYVLQTSWWLSVPLTVLASLAMLRAVYFVHEIAHLGPGKVPLFEWVWSVVAGVPTLMPSLMVSAHKYHHRQSTYGTARDPEYAPIARWSFFKRVFNVLVLAMVPPLLVVRWGVIAPLSWLIPPLRRVAIERLSTLQVSDNYKREMPEGREAVRYTLGEISCALFVFCVTYALHHHIISPGLLLHYWVMFALALMINQVRTFVAHAYRNDGTPLTHDAQLDDTLTLGGGWLTEIVAPLGDRFHALHHALPSVPYHALGEIHRILMKESPISPRYARTFRRGVLGALLVLETSERRNHT
jgi:fatty acid desaturase